MWSLAPALPNLQFWPSPQDIITNAQKNAQRRGKELRHRVTPMRRHRKCKRISRRARGKMRCRNLMYGMKTSTSRKQRCNHEHSPTDRMISLDTENHLPSSIQNPNLETRLRPNKRNQPKLSPSVSPQLASLQIGLNPR